MLSQDLEKQDLTLLNIYSADMAVHIEHIGIILVFHFWRFFKSAFVNSKKIPKRKISDPPSVAQWAQSFVC